MSKKSGWTVSKVSNYILKWKERENKIIDEETIRNYWYEI